MNADQTPGEGTAPMADCNETLRELETFLDGELSDEAQEHIRSHLVGCLDCLQAFDFHAEFRQVVSEKCRNDELPAGLVARIERCFGDDLHPEDGTR